MAEKENFGLSDDLRDMKSSSKFESLPIGIRAEILANLPVESLMKLKSLNKSWYFFIRCLVKDPEFVAKHLHRFEASQTLLLVCNHACGFFVPRDENSELSACSFFEPWNEHSELSTDSDDELVTSARLIRSVDIGDNNAIRCITEDLGFPLLLQQVAPFYLGACHCNGVVCLTTDSDALALYNPALREFDLFRPKSRLREKCVVGIGFGCDSTGRAYKVVRLIARNKRNKAEVFVPGTSSSWREINMDIEEKSFNLEYHVYLKGNCFWLMTSNPSKMVLRFSVGSETFRSIPLPQENSPSFVSKIWSLNLYNDSICAALSKSEEIVLWVMDVDNKSGKHVWTKLLRFECGPYSTFRTFWKSDEVLVETEDGAIMWYNRDTGELRSSSLDLWMDRAIYLDRYVKSLVSVKGMNQA